MSLAIAVAIYGSKTTTQTPAAIAQVATSMGVAPENVGKVIEDFLSHNFAGLAQIPGVSGRVIGAIVEASNALAIQGFKVVWFAFLPGAVIATIGSCFLINPKDRINMIVGKLLLVLPYREHKLTRNLQTLRWMSRTWPPRTRKTSKGVGVSQRKRSRHRCRER